MEAVKRTRQSKDGKYYVPDEVKALRPEPLDMTTVKKISGQYYVYSLKRVSNKEKPGKTKKTTDKIIGKIENGIFIPNDTPRIIDTYPDILDCGSYLLALSCTADLLKQLRLFFPQEDALLVYILGIIYFVNGYTPARDISDVFWQSMLCIQYKVIGISDDSLGKFLDGLGRHRLPGRRFEQSLINEGSGTYAIDDHVILCCSEYNEIADYGHKYSKLGNKQTNFMVVFDVEKNRALTCGAFDGSIPDKVEVREVFEHHHFKSAWLLIDAGFYSNDNFDLFGRDQCSYLIPVPGMTTIYKIISEQIVQGKEYVGSFAFTRRNKKGKETQTPVLYWETTVSEIEKIAYEKKKKVVEEYNLKSMQEAKEGEKPKKKYAGKLKLSKHHTDRIIIFKDVQMHDKLAEEYLMNIDIDDQHSMEEFRHLDPLFGVIILRTNNQNITPEEAYKKYKKRWKIETFYNYVRNELDFNHFHESNYYVQQGISFLLIVEGYIYSEVLKKIEKAEKPFINRMSVSELKLKAGHLKLSKGLDGLWHRNAIKENMMDLFTEFGVDIDNKVLQLNGMK